MEFIFVIALVLLFNSLLVRVLKSRFDLQTQNYLWILFFIHFLLTICYIAYSYATRSDSFAYYERTSNLNDWFSRFAYGTAFIEFLSYPFIKLFSLSYISVMIIFSYIGYLGILFFYLSSLENIKLNPSFKQLTAVELIFLLPNLHFWTSSLGKGSVITFGLGMFIFGLSRFNRRAIYLILGSLLTLMIRPHIFLVLITGVIIGILITSSGIKLYLKWLIFSVGVILLIYLSQDVMNFANTDTLDILSSENITHRAGELSKANSGVDINNYGIFMKMFTFWFRPLFIDASGAIALVVSFENLIYLILFGYAVRYAFLTWSRWNGWFRISILIFLLGSFILAQVTGNLGIAMRQKAQFMPFFFIIFCKALSYGQSAFTIRKS